MTPRVFLYLRESRDEGGEHRERIDTQRKMLMAYCREHSLGNVVGEIADDDVTGTEFHRLNRVRELAEAGKIDILLLKDASRLGRNLKESLVFTEFLEEHGVELCFAGGSYNEDFFPLEAWFHEMRAKEDSRKIRGVLYHKMAAGEFLISPPYGYIREGYRLRPDPAVVWVVQYIFRAFLQGKSTGEIARELNAKAIPTPSAQKGIRGASDLWSAGSIRRILGDAGYTGLRINKKTVGKSFKNKKRIETKPEERFIFPEDHQKIITQEEFEAANRLLRQSARGSGQASPYRGMVFCGGCGSRMMLRARTGRECALICPLWHRKGAGECTSHHIRVADLDAAVRGAVRGFYQIARWDSRHTMVTETDISMETLYEDLLSGRITAAFFEKMREKLKNRPKPPQFPDDVEPMGREEELGRILVEKMEVLEPSDGVECKTLRVWLGA